MRRSGIIALAVSGAALTADQLSKWISIALPEGGVRLFPGILAVRFTNSGLAGSIPIPEAILIPLAVAALTFVAAGLLRSVRAGHPVAAIAWGLILGGGLSNLADRVLRGGVLDILRVGPVSYINLADAEIALGILLVLIKPKKLNFTHSHQLSEEGM